MFIIVEVMVEMMVGEMVDEKPGGRWSGGGYGLHHGRVDKGVDEEDLNIFRLHANLPWKCP